MAFKSGVWYTAVRVEGALAPDMARPKGLATRVKDYLMSTKKYLIGVDLGGTKIFTALADLNGRILSEVVLPTNASRGQASVTNTLKQSIKQVLESAEKSIVNVKAIGIGAPGPVISKKGIVVNPPNLPGWKAVPLAAIVKKTFNVPVYLENDANAAAVGELKFGAAKGARNFLYVTVSTGIGGGIVIDGKVYGGSNGSAGEIGHTIIEPTGEVCGCGRKGCFEIMASGRALTRYGKEFLGRELQPVEIERLAEQGNLQALKAIDKLAYYLAIGLGNQINTLSPELIVIGGGISNLGPLLFHPLGNYLKQFALPSNLKGCKIKRAKLGKQAGVLGAIAICL